MGIAMSENHLSASHPDHTLGQYNGSKIRCKFVDGVPFLNATDMCQAAGKRWAKYWENKQTREFVEELGSGPNSDIIETSKTRGDLGGGTWVHEDIAYHLAAWCAPAFSLWMIRTVKAVTQGKPVPRELAEAKVADYGLLVEDITTLQTTVADVVQRMAIQQDRMAAQQEQITELFKELVPAVRRIDDRTKGQREEVRSEDKRRLVSCVEVRFGGVCPCCHNVQVADAGKRVPDVSQIDHYHHRSMSQLEYVWLVCKTCNRKLRQRKPGQFWMMKASAFAHFQELLHETDQMLLPFTEVAQ